jgi:hypothetical protein
MGVDHLATYPQISPLSSGLIQTLFLHQVFHLVGSMGIEQDPIHGVRKRTIFWAIEIVGIFPEI